MHASLVPVGRGGQRPLPQQRCGPGHRQRQVPLGWARAGALTPDPNAHLNPNPSPNPSPSPSPSPNPNQARLAFAQEIMEGNLALAQPQPAAEGEFAAY